MKYPKIIYVTVFKENSGDEYLNAYKSTEEADNGKVAVYVLKEIKTKTTKVELS